jgi:hypothetical protein
VNRVGSGFTPTGQYSRGRGVWKGTCSFQTDSRTSVRDGSAPETGDGLHRGTPARGCTAPSFVRAGSRTFAGEGSASGLKNEDDRYTRRDLKSIQCYNCGLYGHYRGVCRFRKEPPKRDREDELHPVVLPECKPPSGPVLIVPSATKGLVTEPLLTVEIGRERVISLW